MVAEIDKLSNKMLGGSFSWSSLQYLTNFLTGPIPPHMCKEGAMRELLMLENKLTGEIPASYGNCTSLRRFRISNNSISGSVPAGIWGLPNLNIIDIQMNKSQHHRHPNERDCWEHYIGHQECFAKALGELFTGYNKLSGELPKEISQVSSLVSVELNNNQFSGKIPDKIRDLKQLSNLQLQNNKLSEKSSSI